MGFIKRRVGQCIDCTPETKPRILIKGRCETHYWINLYNEKNSRGIKEDHIELGIWFDYHNNACSWVCDNCQSKLIPFSPETASSCQAHILPKEHFPSVKTNLDNHLTLGGLFQKCFCHADYDSSWEKAVSMPVIHIAKEKFLLFKHLLRPEELRRLPQVFRDLM